MPIHFGKNPTHVLTSAETFDPLGKTPEFKVAAVRVEKLLVEVAMGLYLMESLRITRLFPVIGSMDDRMRVRMIWITFGSYTGTFLVHFYDLCGTSRFPWKGFRSSL